MSSPSSSLAAASAPAQRVHQQQQQQQSNPTSSSSPSPSVTLSYPIPISTLGSGRSIQATKATITPRQTYRSIVDTNTKYSASSSRHGSTFNFGSTSALSKSAPTSPSGRLAPLNMHPTPDHAVTPMSNITSFQLAPSSIHGQTGQSTHISPSPSSSPSASQVLPPAPSHIHSLPIHPDSFTQTSGVGVRPLFFSSKPPDATPPSKQQIQQKARARQSLQVNSRSTVSGMISDDSAFDSDTTVRPGAGPRMANPSATVNGNGNGNGTGEFGSGRYKQSLSQPDLTVLRSKRTEGWADQVAKGHNQTATQPQPSEERRASTSAAIPGFVNRRPSLGRNKTPPSRTTTISQPIPIPISGASASASAEAWLPASAGRSPKQPRSRSSTSLSGLRGSPSPRSSTLTIPIMSPITSISRASLSSSSPDTSPRPPFIRSATMSMTMTGSEDADDDYESTDSPSSGSLTFSPKRTRAQSIRHRFPFPQEKGKTPSSMTSSLGLSLGASTNDTSTPDEAVDVKDEPLPLIQLERLLQRSSLLSLRLLAIVPSLWGICVLLQALFTGGLWHDVWPWGVDLSTEALERLVQGDRLLEGTWREVSRGDMLLSIAWAICTAHFCFHLTTGLTHRWRSYYSLPSTITRLVSLQCLCWPATYLTLWILGAEKQRPLLAWVVIGVTTGWSRTIQMWVTSNVVQSASTNTKNIKAGGDITPNGIGINKRSPQGPPIIPDGLTAWETFNYGRKWDWDAVARKVGWKVGALLLVTTAWLFWGIENGRVVRG